MIRRSRPAPRRGLDPSQTAPGPLSFQDPSPSTALSKCRENTRNRIAAVSRQGCPSWTHPVSVWHPQGVDGGAPCVQADFPSQHTGLRQVGLPSAVQGFAQRTGSAITPGPPADSVHRHTRTHTHIHTSEGPAGGNYRKDRARESSLERRQDLNGEDEERKSRAMLESPPGWACTVPSPRCTANPP